MHSRQKRAFFVIALALLTPMGLAVGQTEDAGYRIESITESLHFLRNPESPFSDNVLVSVGSDGILLVDDAYVETESEIRELIGTLHTGPVDMVVNTHYHHAGGNDVFGNEALVVGHARTRERMQSEQSMYAMRSIGPWSSVGLPEVTFESKMTIHFNDERIDLLHLPNAHTDGDLVAFFRESNVVATGDVFVPMLAVCDFSSGCVWDRFVDAVEQLAQLIPEDAVVVPGHGPLSSQAEVAELAELLKEVTGQVRNTMAEGATEEQIVAKGLPAKWQHWADRGVPVDFFLSNVYQSLGATR